MTPRARTFTVLLLPLATLLVASPAPAQNVPAADALFNKGKAELAAKNYKVACPAFLESYKLDPVPGALYALAQCHEEAGNIATAVARYDEYLRLIPVLPEAQKAKHRARVETAKTQRAALAPEVPELTLVLSSAPQGTRVVQDGVELSVVSLGLGLPIDPGDHAVTVQTPGSAAVEQRFTITRGEKKRIDLDALLKEPQRAAQAPSKPGAGAGEPSTAPGPLVTTTELPPPPPSEGGMSGRRVAAFAIGGVGVAGLVVGAVTGGLVLGKKSGVDAGCKDVADGKSECNAEGLAAAESAQTLGLVSTIGFGVGLAGVAVGAVLFLTEPKEAKSETARRWIRVGITSAGPGGAAAGVKGVW